MGVEHRTAQEYDSAYTGFQHTWRFLVTEVKNDDVNPVDLSAYDSVKLQIYQNTTDSSLLADISCTVLTGTTDLEESVQARCEAVWTAATDTYSAGNYRARLVGVSGSTLEIFEKPWIFEVFVGGPTS